MSGKLAGFAGLEPRGFFNVVQFVMSDRESVGSVSLQVSHYRRNTEFQF
jgi:hypothetical protein